MPGGLGSHLGSGRPGLKRSKSMHPAQMEELELSLEDTELNHATVCDELTPHEPLSLEWPFPLPSTSATTVDTTPALEALPPLPPIETAPLGGPLSRSFQAILSDDTKFLRPVPKTNGPSRRINPTLLPATSRKRPHAEDQAEPVATASPPTPPAAHMPPPAPRKKRRGTRPGTYMCLYKGELFECPHGCDIVDKNLLYDLLRRT